MKKLLLMFLFITPIALAVGQTIYLDDFSDNPIQIIILGERDRLAFNMLEGKHTIIIDKVSNESADLSIFPYLKDNLFITINSKKYIKLDLNRDHIIDLMVRLQNINGKNATISLEKVSIDERTPYEKKYNVSLYNTTQEYTDQSKEKNYVNYTILAAIGILIIVVIGYFLIPKKHHKKNHKCPKK